MTVCRNHTISLRILLYIFLFSLLICCSSSKKSFYEEQPAINLYAFVGKRVTIERFDATMKRPITRYFDKELGDTISSRHVSLSLDAAYHCTYAVSEPVFNKLTSDTVEFNAYSHSTNLGFEKSEYVLLYLSKDSTGKFYQQKYQYDLLIRNSEGYFGVSGKSIKHLFNQKRYGVFKSRGVF